MSRPRSVVMHRQVWQGLGVNLKSHVCSGQGQTPVPQHVTLCHPMASIMQSINHVQALVKSHVDRARDSEGLQALAMEKTQVP